MSQSNNQHNSKVDSAPHLKSIVLSDQLDLAKQHLDTCMVKDRHVIRSLISKIQRTTDPKKQQVERGTLEKKISQSSQIYQSRLASLPKQNLHVNPDLPINDKAEEICEAIKAHQVVIVAGDTGSGKSTQLPKICLMAGRGLSGYIGHTQPRRIAARSIADRLSEELQSELGDVVGYKVRFTDITKPQSYVKLMTDGILLAELQRDRYLNQYDTIIIDEAHERSLNIDFLLGYLKGLLIKRPDLKIIITSATIDTERFANHFASAPIITVEGRTFPVETHYINDIADKDNDDDDISITIRKVVDNISEQDPQGDILIFVSGESEIRQCITALQRPPVANTLLLPLYARLAAKAQNEIFASNKKRKIVVATNIAETSLTIPGIRYVIDSGYARISRYSFRNKVQRLPIEKISQASANQRKGRCGRVANGICYRLYSEEDFQARPEYAEPEIMRTNLAAVILQMEASGLGDIRTFPFIDPPDHRYINDGYKLLFELSAVDERHHITGLGRTLARFPLDPRLAKMLVTAKQEQCVQEMLVITSALGIQDIRERSLTNQLKSQEKHQAFYDKQSDFLFYTTVWAAIKDLKSGELSRFCKQNYFGYMRIQEWRDIYRQLASHIKNFDYEINTKPATYNQIHRSILSGLITLVGLKGDDNVYSAPRNVNFLIGNRSSLQNKSPKWVMVESLIQTHRLYGYNVARIFPKWIEDVAGHLLQRSYFDAEWDSETGRVYAFERSVLYGLPIQSRRKVDYGRVAPLEAHDIFIQKALVEGNLKAKFDFYLHNQAILNKYDEIETKLRMRNIVVHDAELYAFYKKHIPATVCSRETLTHWLRTHKDEEEKLKLTDEQATKSDKVTDPNALYPDKLTIKNRQLDLLYDFEPGHERDGVTVNIPIFLLHQFEEKDFDFLVPGMVRQKIIALIKTLPKSLRTSFVPATNYADHCMKNLVTDGESLVTQITKLLKQKTGIQIPANSWRLEQLPDHLLMNYVISDENKRHIAMGRNLDLIKSQLKKDVKRTQQAMPKHELECDNVTEWSFGDLPENTIQHVNGHEVIKYPALIDNQNSVSVRLLTDPIEAMARTKQGMIRLFLINCFTKISYLRKNLPFIEQMAMWYTSIGDANELKQTLEILIVNEAFFPNQTDVDEIRNKQKFEDRCATAQNQLLLIMNDVCELTQKILEKRWQVSREINAANKSEMLEDVALQLKGLFPPRFLAIIPYKNLQRYPAYLDAIAVRLQKYQTSPAADQDKQKQINPYQARCDQLRAEKTDAKYTSAQSQFRWMLEEFRISLFAQNIKTAMPVSRQRLDKFIKEMNG